MSASKYLFPNEDLHSVTGAVGIPGSAFKGIYEEVRGGRYKSKEIEAKLIARGLEEWEFADMDVRKRVLSEVMQRLYEFDMRKEGAA